ncbi:peptidase S8/S53 domain-containing protein, partial [Thamnocephalis sphaerospora]
HDMTGVDRVRKRQQNTGKGIKVGVVDSGIDYTHPALGGCFGDGCRVAFGHDFVGDNYLGNGRSQPEPDIDPRDTCNGHGTHVAGIIGADDAEFQGVAPHVTLGAYRVFGCKGSSETDVIIAGMEKAFLDGMDIINMSLGGGSSWAEYPDAAAAARLAERGVVVVASMGNDGDKGMWEASSPGLGPNVIAVGSVDSMRYQATGFTFRIAHPLSVEYLSDKETALDINNAAIASAQSTSDPEGMGCQGMDKSLSGKLVLVKRGSCTFNIKAENAKKAGATALIVYNNIASDVFIPSVTSADSIPVVGITQANGEKLLVLLSGEKANDVVASFPKTMITFDNPNGGHMSRFSSYGPGPELDLKPDVAAPGGLIRSTYPVPMGSYRTLSGTSMSSPYVAGAAALYLAAKGKSEHAPTLVREMFQTTARPIKQGGGTDRALASIVRQGAGLLDIEAAINATTLVEPSRLALNDSMHGGSSKGMAGAHTANFVVRNTLGVPLRYTVRHLPALASQGHLGDIKVLSKPNFQDAPASVVVIAADNSNPLAEFTVPANGATAVTITVSPPNKLSPSERWMYGGFIELVDSQQRTLHIPYMGMNGDLHAQPILDRDGFPSLTRMLRSALDENTVNSMSLQRPANPVEDQGQQEPKDSAALGILPNSWITYLGRHSNDLEDYAFDFAFDGTYTPMGLAKKGLFNPNLGSDSTTLDLLEGNNSAKDDVADGKVVVLPDGYYRLRAQALRPFGDEERPSDWDVWLSPLLRL